MGGPRWAVREGVGPVGLQWGGAPAPDSGQSTWLLSPPGQSVGSETCHVSTEKGERGAGACLFSLMRQGEARE